MVTRFKHSQLSQNCKNTAKTLHTAQNNKHITSRVGALNRTSSATAAALLRIIRVCKGL